MWVTFVIAAGFFAACIAMGYFAVEEHEQQQEREAASRLENAPEVRSGRCMLCNAPLRRAATSDEVVFELEHRIDSELRDIAHALHAAPESFGRILRA